MTSKATAKAASVAGADPCRLGGAMLKSRLPGQALRRRLGSRRVLLRRIGEINIQSKRSATDAGSSSRRAEESSKPQLGRSNQQAK